MLAVASVGMWCWLADRLKRGPILEYEPRRPVPWHGVLILLPVLLVAFTVFAAIAATIPRTTRRPPRPTWSIASPWIGPANGVRGRFPGRGDRRVGRHAGGSRLAEGWGQFLRRADRHPRLARGARAVYGAQIVMVNLFGPTEGHPLIKIVQEHPSPLLFMLAFVAAVVVAPVCEELLFRMLLQGWLEKWEDRWLGWRMPTGTAERYGDYCRRRNAEDIAASDGISSSLRRTNFDNLPASASADCPTAGCRSRELATVRAGPPRLRSGTSASVPARVDPWLRLSADTPHRALYGDARFVQRRVAVRAVASDFCGCPVRAT